MGWAGGGGVVGAEGSRGRPPQTLTLFTEEGRRSPTDAPLYTIFFFSEEKTSRVIQRKEIEKIWCQSHSLFLDMM